MYVYTHIYIYIYIYICIHIYYKGRARPDRGLPPGRLPAAAAAPPLAAAQNATARHGML